ncbi:MAG TPA: SO2930 family diheme c-type cytochrome [Burkholderiaceae bacterium]
MQYSFSLRRCLAALFLFACAACSQAPQPVNFVAEGRPEKLSDWHVLQVDGGRLKLNEGVQPYALNTALFSDYAHKLRTVWMPKGQAANYDAEKVFDFPVGAIISKTFFYPKAQGAALLQNTDTGAEFKDGALDLQSVRLIETRLLVKRADGWAALAYVWNEAQTEATLARTGDQMPLELQDEAGKTQRFTYVVPNENQCASCHMTQMKSRAVQPIGPKARHLNRAFTFANGVSENQLAHLVKVGYLQGLPAADVPKNANAFDASQPLAARARAYLDVNCSHCHSGSGPANTTALNLEPFNAPDHRLGLCKPPVAAGKGTGSRLFGVVPGQPDASIMLYRLASTEGGEMMPELGRSTVHREGLALIRQWVTALEGSCNPATPQNQ